MVAAVLISVVIPTLNESAALPRLLALLREQRDVALELVVADGGSTDATLEHARAAGALALAAPRGRGAQMNAGARASSGTWLLFLHADSAPTSDTQLARALALLQAQAPRCAGHFPLRFERTVPGHDRLFAYMEGKTRTSRPWTINGDQGLLLSRAFFDELGGFDESLPFLEDQRIAARIFERGTWLLLPDALLTSARRFEREGVVERYTLMALIMALHEAGVREFFDQAGALYASQDQARRLDLGAFCALIRRILWRRRWRGMLRIGAFVRANAWQLAYRADLTRGSPRWLPWFDRRLARRLDHRFWDVLAAGLACLWFYAVLPLRLAHRSSAAHC